MKEFNIIPSDAGRRLDKYIMQILPKAPSSFVYKMLRKKNIVLNGSKASGNELLSGGDNVKIYLSDETFEKFAKGSEETADLSQLMPPIVYEDDDFLIVNKPSGMLSQRAKADDVSLNEICLSYVITRSGSEDGTSFTPSICNRLDRNTSGIVTFAKTYRAAKTLSQAFRDHTLGKYYRCLATGNVKKASLEGRLVKDEKTNKVSIISDSDYGDYIKTEITPVKTNGDATLVDIKLVTGKTHQIRAHLASCGTPVIGDPKYGDRTVNERYRKNFGITSQMLVCYRLVIPDDGAFLSIAGKTFEIPMPPEFEKVL